MDVDVKLQEVDGRSGLSGGAHPAISDELLKMAEADQALRQSVIEDQSVDAPNTKRLPEPVAALIRRVQRFLRIQRAVRRGLALDAAHTRRLKEIVAGIGWPTNSKVDRQASHMAWLLAQHADHDVAFQRQCLRLMREAPEGEVNKADVAYLEDRVRVNEGFPQRYGTQFHTDASGELVPRPIEEPEALDQRRAEVGLSSFEEYRQIMREFAKQSPAPKPTNQQPG